MARCDRDCASECVDYCSYVSALLPLDVGGGAFFSIVKCKNIWNN